MIYHPEYSKRHHHQPFEVYQLSNQRYQLQPGEPAWMPEVGLGIGRVQGNTGGIEREWLAWHDQGGTASALPQERLRQEQQRAEQAEQALAQERLKKLRLQEKLRPLGLDPEQVLSWLLL